MAKKPKKKEWRLTVRLPAELREPVEAARAADSRTVNSWITKAVRGELGGRT